MNFQSALNFYTVKGKNFSETLMFVQLVPLISTVFLASVVSVGFVALFSRTLCSTLATSFSFYKLWYKYLIANQYLIHSLDQGIPMSIRRSEHPKKIDWNLNLTISSSVRLLILLPI